MLYLTTGVMMKRLLVFGVLIAATVMVGYFAVTSTAVPKYEVVREDSVEVEVFSFAHVELRHDGQLDQRKAEKNAKDYLRKIGAKRGIVVVEDDNSSFTNETPLRLCRVLQKSPNLTRTPFDCPRLTHSWRHRV